MDNECIDAILRIISGEREKELEIVKNCPFCHYKNLDRDGCEIYRNIRLAAMAISMKHIPELCPIRDVILAEKAKLKRQSEEFEARHNVNKGEVG